MNKINRHIVAAFAALATATAAWAQHPVVLLKSTAGQQLMPAKGKVLVVGPLAADAKAPLLTALGKAMPKVKFNRVTPPKSDPCRDLYRDRGGRTPGLRVEYWNNANLGGKSQFAETVDALDFDWGGASPNTQLLGSDYFSMRYTGYLHAPQSGDCTLVLTSTGGSKLWIDDRLVIDNWGQHARLSKSAVVNLTQGRDYRVRIDYASGAGNASLQLGYTQPEQGSMADDAATANAVLLTAQADGWTLPAQQLGMIRQVAAANPRTLLLVQAPGAVDLAGVDSLVSAVAYVQQLDAAKVAGVLAGKADATGRLVAQWNKDATGAGLVLDGSKAGQHNYVVADEAQLNSTYPFGHGHSTCEFFYTNLKAKQKGMGVQVSLEVSNLSKHAGTEVVQVYVKGPKGGLNAAMTPVTLNAGSHKKVQVSLDPSLFTTVVPGRGRIVIPGEYQIFAGSSQASIQLLSAVKMK